MVDNNTTFVLKPTLLFAIAAGLIVFAMLMGRRQDATQRSSLGRWIGLTALLLIASCFIVFTQMRGGVRMEERYSGRSALDHAITQMKDRINEGMATAKESLEGGMNEVSKGMEEVQKSLSKAGSRGSSSASRGNRTSTSSSASKTTRIPMPTTEVGWTVELNNDDHSQRVEVVIQRLHEQAAKTVNRWINERLPLKNYALQCVNSDWLSEHNAFPTPPMITPQPIDRANTNLKDTLFGGSIKIVLPPALQQTLLEKGFSDLEEAMQNEKYDIQFVMFIVLMGLAGLSGLLGMARLLVRR